MAASVAVMAGFELSLQKAATAPEYATILRGAHVAIFFLTVSLVLFVRTYLRAGPPWLAWAVITARGAALIANFLHAPNLNFESITGLRTVWLLGDRASVAVGIPSRWTRLGELSSVSSSRSSPARRSRSGSAARGAARRWSAEACCCSSPSPPGTPLWCMPA